MRNIGSGRTAATVILVGLENDDMGRVRETLAAEAVLPSNSTGFGDALTAIRRTRPDVVIVSFSQGIEAPLALAQAVQRETVSSTLVALSDESEAEHILAAMRVGYKEFVVLPRDSQRLRQVVHEAAYAPSDDEERGVVVAFIGAKGGVGTTFLAVQVAAELAAINRVLAIDMDFAMGDMASILDLNPKDSIMSLLPRADRIDERMLTGSVTVHGSKVHVLAQQGDLDPTIEVNSDDIYGIIGAACKGYQYILIDCGTYLDEAVAMSLNVADIVVVVTEPTVVSVRDCYRRIQLLDTMGVEKDRVRLVVNRYSNQAFVSEADIQRNLGISVAGVIADDPKTVLQATNEGRLVRELNRKSEVIRDIASLVAILTDDVEAEAGDNIRDDSKSGFLFGLFNRG
jgi:pilus assembly protein CpaE